MEKFGFAYFGGDQRSETVLKGLIFLKQIQKDYKGFILVHDAVRPLLTQHALKNILLHQI